MTIDIKLVDLCRHVDELSNELGHWIGLNTALLGAETAAARQMLHRFQTQTKCLQDAVGSRACLGVIGPGGAGKTHLIAGLAGRGAAPLRAEFEGLPNGADYAREICGDTAASSGVVTRFTTQNNGTPTKFPVAVQLLSQVELIKILAHSYFSGSICDRLRGPTAGAIEELTTRLGRNLGPNNVAGLDDHDLWMIRLHLDREFITTSAYSGLAASGYWDYFTAMMPRLSQSGRTAMLSVLWGGEPFYTRLYETVVEAMDKLGHERQAYCAMSSLCDVAETGGVVRASPDSILSIKPLYRFGQEDDDTVLVRSKHGAWAAIKRSVLAIMVAEIRIHLTDDQGAALEHIDVLEFCGMNPAVGESISTEYAAQPYPFARTPPRGTIVERDLTTVFAQTKGQHLFAAYHERREITCLVVCADAAHRDLSNWARGVTRWVNDCLGAEAGERSTNEDGLFVVLTKLDEAIDQSAAQAANWTARLEQSLRQGIGRGGEWTQNWLSGQAFKNVYLLRSPHYRSPRLCDYLANGLELCIKASRAGDVALARECFLQNELVRTHVADPPGAWREAMEPGDGGLSYLSQSVMACCSDAQKHRQIGAELTRLRAELTQRLLRFHVSHDMFAQHDARRRGGVRVGRAIERCVSAGAHGKLLHKLHLAEDHIGAMLHNIDTNPYRDNKNYAPPVRRGPGGALRSLSDTLQSVQDNVPPQPPQTLSPSQLPSPSQSPHDPAEHNVPPGTVWQGPAKGTSQIYAASIMSQWANMLRAVQQTPQIQWLSGLGQADFATLIDEILIAAMRHNLETQLAQAIEAGLSAQMNMSVKASKAAIIAAEMIGAFVDCLGFNETWAEHHPRRKGRAQTIIFPPSQAINLRNIVEARSQFETPFSNDWSIAYLAMVEDNAEYLRRTRFDLEEDRQLGDLLKALLPSEVWPVFRSCL